MDLFKAINALFTKEPIDPVPSGFMLHRFLSSEPQYAIIACELQRFCKDDERLWKIWKDALPKKKKAPFLKYPAPKRAVSSELIQRYADVNNLNYIKAEQEIELLVQLKLDSELRTELGIE